MLMVEGRFIYQGRAADATDYFCSHFGLGCGEFQNPADYFMSIMHHEDPANRARYDNYFKTYVSKAVGKVEHEIENAIK